MRSPHPEDSQAFSPDGNSWGGWQRYELHLSRISTKVTVALERDLDKQKCDFSDDENQKIAFIHNSTLV